MDININQLATAIKDELMRELRDAGMLLTENEAREYLRYKATSDELITQAEAARLLGVSPQTIMRMRANGSIKAVIVNGSARFKKKTILNIKK